MLLAMFHDSVALRVRSLTRSCCLLFKYCMAYHWWHGCQHYWYLLQKPMDAIFCRVFGGYSAAWIIMKYDSGLSLLRHEELHWLDVIDRVRYKLAVLAYRSLHGTASQSEVTGRQYLRSAAQQKLIVPRCRRKTFGCRAFSVASPSVWNALPDSLRDPELTLDIFRRHLKTYFFTLY